MLQDVPFREMKRGMDAVGIIDRAVINNAPFTYDSLAELFYFSVMLPPDFEFGPNKIRPEVYDWMKRQYELNGKLMDGIDWVQGHVNS